MKGRLLEESEWYCGSSDGRGGSEIRHTRSEAGEALEGSVFYKLRSGGILYPTHPITDLIICGCGRALRNWLGSHVGHTILKIKIKIILIF